MNRPKHAMQNRTDSHHGHPTEQAEARDVKGIDLGGPRKVA
jgi:hypothetical protein